MHGGHEFGYTGARQFGTPHYCIPKLLVQIYCISVLMMFMFLTLAFVGVLAWILMYFVLMFNVVAVIVDVFFAHSHITADYAN